MFALPKWLTDIKKLLDGADGKVLARENGAWVFLQGVAAPPITPAMRMAELGIYVGDTEPVLITYAEWVLAGTGFWAWLPTNSNYPVFQLAGSTSDRGTLLFDDGSGASIPEEI